MKDKRTFTKKKDGDKRFVENKSFGEKKTFSERKSFDERKPFSEKKSFGDRKPSGSGDRRSYSDKKSYGDRKPFGAGRSFGDRKPSGDRSSFGDKKTGFSRNKPNGFSRDKPSGFSRDKQSGFSRDRGGFQHKPVFKKEFKRDNDYRRDDEFKNEFKKYDDTFKETLQPGLFQKGRSFFTRNATPGKTYFDKEYEKTIDGVKYREVDPTRSKFVAAIAKGLQQTGLAPGSVILYLGASHGYTPSFFSDLIAVNGKLAGKGAGMMFCLDFAPRVVRDLYFVCKSRDNMAPIMGDAAQPQTYEDLVPKNVDVVYQDIAQRNQVEIFLKNCDMYLKQGGFGMLAVKARSIDVTKRPQELFKLLRKELEDNKGYTVIDYRELAPFEKDHAFFTVKKK